MASPPSVHVIQLKSHGVTRRDPTLGQATFAHATVGPSAGTAAGTWRDTDVTPPPNATPPAPPHDFGLPYVPIIRGGGTPQADGSITVKGSGDIGKVGMGGISLADEDRAKASLLGAQFGLIGAVAVGVLYMTSEFKTRTIGITFAQSPRRGTVLAAKTAVLAGLVFVTGLVVSVAAFFHHQTHADPQRLRSTGLSNAEDR